MSVKSVHAGMADACCSGRRVKPVLCPATRLRRSNRRECNQLSSQGSLSIYRSGNAERFRRDHKGDVFCARNEELAAYKISGQQIKLVSQRMHKTVRSIIEEGARNIDDQDALLRWRKRSEDNAPLELQQISHLPLKGL